MGGVKLENPFFHIKKKVNPFPFLVSTHKRGASL